MIAPLIRKLERFGPLSDKDRELLNTPPFEVRQIEARQVLIQGDIALSHCHLLLDGIAYRYKMVDGGRRQIMSFHMAGDILDLTGLLLGKLDHSIGSLTQGSVALLPHPLILSWMERVPHLGHLLWRDTLIDAAVLSDWVVNVAQRTADARIAHLLCELVTRVCAVGVALDCACSLPITQRELADATGLSGVHVNRVLRHLCDQGLVAFHENSLVVRGWEGLKRAARYEQSYLHQLASAA